jgi:hypothetical protein
MPSNFSRGFNTTIGVVCALLVVFLILRFAASLDPAAISKALGVKPAAPVVPVDERVTEHAEPVAPAPPVPVIADDRQRFKPPRFRQADKPALDPEVERIAPGDRVDEPVADVAPPKPRALSPAEKEAAAKAELAAARLIKDRKERKAALLSISEKYRGTISGQRAEQFAAGIR